MSESMGTEIDSESERRRRVFITGGTRGIGLATVRALAPSSEQIFILARDRQRLDSAIERLRTEYLGCEFVPVCADLSDLPTLRSELQRVPLKHLDALVLDAGTYTEGSLSTMNVADYQVDLNINLNSMLVVVQETLPALRLGLKARIVIVGSTAAYEPYPLVPSYGVAKFGVRGLAINLRQELVPDRIGVCLVSPGGTLTDMWEGEDLPVGRLLEPSDIAKVIEVSLSLSEQAVVDEVIVRPMLGDIHE